MPVHLRAVLFLMCFALPGFGRAETKPRVVVLDEQTSIEFELPGPVQNLSTPIELPDGYREATILGAQEKPSAYFIASYLRPTGASPDAAIAAEVERCVANIGGRVESRRSVEGDYPTVEVVARTPRSSTLVITCRIICDRRRIYSLTAINPMAPASTPPGGTTRFFATFRIRNEASKP